MLVCNRQGKVENHAGVAPTAAWTEHAKEVHVISLASTAAQPRINRPHAAWLTQTLPMSSQPHLICCHCIRLYMRVAPPPAAAFAMQGRSLTADGAANKLDVFIQT
jgi:hypothetical protein